MLIAIGAMITTVAGLLSTGVIAMVMVRMTASMTSGPTCPEIVTMLPPISRAASVSRSASPSGIIAPRSTITGQSMFS